MNGENGTGKGIQFNRTITLGNILTLAMILTSAATFIWRDAVHQVQTDNNIQGMQAVVNTQQTTINDLTQAINQQTRVNNILQQRLRDFPLHRHVGSTIIYPGPCPGCGESMPPPTDRR